ncbi:MAG: fibronectin type III domain-containing protein [Oscillospiraceae bacterium]|nr:fibronectin type III domain-containing protein [Oscillospiraceae bacterium]
MKRKRFSAVLGCILALALIAGVAIPIAYASPVTLTVLNPKGEVVPLDNQPLAARLGDIEGAEIALAYFNKNLNKETLAALAEMLAAEYDDVNFTAISIDEQWDALEAGDYVELAGYDAVIFGVADTAASAWWSSYHAKVVEGMGTPTVVVVNSPYEGTQYFASEDNGFTAMRRAVMNRQFYALAYTTLSGATSSVYGLSVFRSAVDYLKSSVVNKANLDPSGFDKFAAFTKTNTVYEQVVYGLTAPLEPNEIAPPVITADQIMDIANTATISISASSLKEAENEFNAMAIEHYFGDGLPLVLPTEAAVSTMLAATTRGSDEVLGKMKMRGGIITVEKVAINSVMAGARPEYFPVILAAMEAYASAWEDQRLYWNAFSSEELHSFMLLLNGPLGKELGIACGKGYGSAAEIANNTIGRAFRLCVRNIGLNKTPSVDTSAKYGRMNDIALLVTREFEEDLPAGWKPHHVMMGYGAEQSTVTLLAIGADVSFRYFGGQDNDFSVNGMFQDIRNHLNDFKSSAAIVAMPAGNVLGFIESGITTYSDTGAVTATGYKLDTKEKFCEQLMKIGTRETPASYTASLPAWDWPGPATSTTTVPAAPVYDGPNANRLQSPKLVYPIMLGDDPAFGRIFGIPTFGTKGFQTQLITGATLTAAGKGATVPSAPQDLTAKTTVDGRGATLRWAAPAGNGGSSITGYQVSCDDGVTWIDAGMATQYKFTGLDPNGEYFFWARAKCDVVNSAEITGSGIFMLGTDTRAVDNQASGRGAWAAADTSVEVGSIKISGDNNGASMFTVSRNSMVSFYPDVNNGANTSCIVWSVSDPSFATVDKDGNVTVFNKMGIVTLLAKDSETNVTNAIVLRIS